MEHYIFSETLEIKELAKSVHIEKMSLKRIKEIIEASATEVYLCGGEFAGCLLDNGRIDQLNLN